MNHRPFRHRALLLASAIAAALPGCAGTQVQPEAPESEALDARSSDIHKMADSRSLEGRAGAIDPAVSCYGAFHPGLDPADDLAQHVGHGPQGHAAGR